MTTSGFPRVGSRRAPSRGLPAVVLGLLDDAAVFPPGLAPLPEAVAGHREYERSWFGGLLGPLVVAASALEELGAVLGHAGRAVGADGDGGASPRVAAARGTGRGALPIAVTLPDGPAGIAGVLDRVSALPASLRALEVSVPAGMSADELLGALDSALAGTSVEVYVEIPRDERRGPLLAALAGTRYLAKFRTGGVRAELYPDEAELAAAIRAAVEGGVAFKATAGLHHALRNTDPETGFEQHGFLNLLLATEAVARGADDADVRALLAERDGAVVAARVRELGEDRVAAARARFLSFGTCSITDPLTELVDLGLVDRPRGES
ncbi:hypothetical protein [Pseudonocardia sp.]|uniref:hypothetical protein n=1 Tax=Pseudonocardia sp. TaxID=60912 RepID=UPI0031FDE4B6